jgi:hypothetical protein
MAIKAKITQQSRIQARTLKIGNIAFNDLTDLDKTDLGDGAMLIFDATTSKYKLTRTLGNINTVFTGGTY